MKIENQRFGIASQCEQKYSQYDLLGKELCIHHPDLMDMIRTSGGISFSKGLFRIHSFGSVYKWTQIATNFFPDLSGEVLCFAYDWLGRQFGVGVGKRKGMILLLDPATGEFFELKQSISGFFEEDLQEYFGDTLETDVFNRLIPSLAPAIDCGECIGYKKPLVLGGGGHTLNFEVMDMEVYWEFMRQIILKIRNLPIGTKIGKIEFD